MIEIITTGKTDIGELFKISGVLDYEKLNHTPFIVFIPSNNKVEIKLAYNKKELLEFPDNTKVMVQWKGEWNSDYFTFTIKDVRDYKDE